MKKQTVIFLSITAALTGVVGFFVYNLYKKPKQFEEISEEQLTEESSGSVYPSTTTSIAPKKLSSTSFPLKKGKVGLEVQVLQRWLNKEGYANPILDDDGDFGPKTLAAVQKMQQYPNEKLILDYNNKKLWENAYTPGEIDSEFYKIFVTKTLSKPNL